MQAARSLKGSKIPLHVPLHQSHVTHPHTRQKSILTTDQSCRNPQHPPSTKTTSSRLQRGPPAPSATSNLSSSAKACPGPSPSTSKTRPCWAVSPTTSTFTSSPWTTSATTASLYVLSGRQERQSCIRQHWMTTPRDGIGCRTMGTRKDTLRR